jgi:hypothetical protein
MRLWRWIALAAACGAAVAATSANAVAARTIDFCGYSWQVRTNSTPGGPGPNRFSDSAENVWVDDQGRLHMRITHTGETWQCAEVTSAVPLAYGTFRWVLDTPMNDLDPHVVLGLFTYSSDTNEIDIEFARWSNPSSANTQYVIQPSPSTPKGVTRWNIGPEASSTHSFTWAPYDRESRPTNVEYLSLGSRGQTLQTARHSQPLAPAPNQRAHLNLWLDRGRAPQGEVEVVIRRFEFIPFKPAQNAP